MIFSNKVYKKRFKKRFLEYFGFEIILSFIIALFYKIGIIPETKPTYAITTSIILASNAIFQFFRLVRCCLRTRSKATYYIMNLLIFALFALANLWLAYLDKEPLYTFLFLGSKLGLVFNFTKIQSALLTNLLMLIIILIVPFRIIEDEDPKE